MVSCIHARLPWQRVVERVERDGRGDALDAELADILIREKAEPDLLHSMPNHRPVVGHDVLAKRRLSKSPRQQQVLSFNCRFLSSIVVNCAVGERPRSSRVSTPRQRWLSPCQDAHSSLRCTPGRMREHDSKVVCWRGKREPRGKHNLKLEYDHVLYGKEACFQILKRRKEVQS